MSRSQSFGAGGGGLDEASKGPAKLSDKAESILALSTYPSFLVLTLATDGVGEHTRSLELENSPSEYLDEERLSPSRGDDMPSVKRDDVSPSESLVMEMPSVSLEGEGPSEIFVLWIESDNLDEIALVSRVLDSAPTEL